MSSAQEAIRALAEFGDETRATNNLWFFKTQPGGYGEGDKFMGASMPNLRSVAARFKDLPRAEVLKLLADEIHENRMLALIIINHQYKVGNEATKKYWYQRYLKNLKYINNWDLVDSSAHKVVGEYLNLRPRQILYKMAGSKDLWTRRVAVIATLRFIGDDDFDDTLALSELLLDDKEDLMHKAVGWMLREIGKRDQKVLIDYLNQHYHKMPRTMLRYAIEKLPESTRQDYLKGRF